MPFTPCNLSEDDATADCTCLETPAWATYYVDINAILNYDAWKSTVEACGVTGEKCALGDVTAPVCDEIFRNKLVPGADLISTFTFHFIPTIPIVPSDCTANPGEILYAGCMTAPCKREADYNPNDEYPIVHCECPTYPGPFQIGRSLSSSSPCDLSPDGNVWSAAYSPDNNGTFPDPPSCMPDMPVENGGCPLLEGPQFEQGDVPVPTNVDCDKVCKEYKAKYKGIEVGYTCDATICTDLDNKKLVFDACGGLGQQSLSEVLKLEIEVGCSCCASQICGCEPKKKTQEKIFRLNKAQERDGVQTQCEINGTLCGKKKKPGQMGMMMGMGMGMGSTSMSTKGMMMGMGMKSKRTRATRGLRRN